MEQLQLHLKILKVYINTFNEENLQARQVKFAS
jgi:hypothetical protein